MSAAEQTQISLVPISLKIEAPCPHPKSLFFRRDGRLWKKPRRYNRLSAYEQGSKIQWAIALPIFLQQRKKASIWTKRNSPLFDVGLGCFWDPYLLWREDNVCCLAKNSWFLGGKPDNLQAISWFFPSRGWKSPVRGCWTRLFLLGRWIGGLTKRCKSFEYHACVVQKWATRVRSAPKS